MKISFSSASDWRKCPQLYYYNYVEGLRPRLEQPAPTLGRILHHYLEQFYDGRSHSNAWLATEAKFEKECKSMAAAALYADEQELGRDLLDLVPRARRITAHYYSVRGRDDHKQHKPLYIEHYINHPLYGDHTAPCIIDLVTQEKATGRVLLWEHKSTGDVPQQGRRLRDLQTLLNAVLLEEAEGVHVDGIVWNYLRTKEPMVPEPLQRGGLTRRRDIDTTWQVYARAVKDSKLNLADYKEMRERLDGRELTVFFPRIELPVLQSESVLLGDLIQTAKDIERATMEWEEGGSDPFSRPVRSISPQCDWCSMRRLCEAVIIGGEGADEELKSRLFKVKERRGEYAASSTFN